MKCEKETYELIIPPPREDECLLTYVDTINDIVPECGKAYMTNDGTLVLIDVNGNIVAIGENGGSSWGHISGDIKNQIDLMNILNQKADKSELGGYELMSNKVYLSEFATENQYATAKSTYDFIVSQESYKGETFVCVDEQWFFLDISSDNEGKIRMYPPDGLLLKFNKNLEDYKVTVMFAKDYKLINEDDGSVIFDIKKGDVFPNAKVISYFPGRDPFLEFYETENYQNKLGNVFNQTNTEDVTNIVNNILKTLSSPFYYESNGVSKTPNVTHTALQDSYILLQSTSGIGSDSYTINGVERQYTSFLLNIGSVSFGFYVKEGDTYSAEGSSITEYPLEKYR